MTEHANLAAALVAALADLSVVEKGRTAKIETKGGGNYTYEYADLGDVVKLTRPVLAQHGVVVLTPIEEHGPGLKCTVVLLHSSGERLDFGPFPFPHGQTAQATGSMVTYYRRYALVAALGIAAGDDDDGAQAQPRQEPRKDEVACRTCGDMIPGALSDPEPMRAHMVDAHEWVRLDDGKVAPPVPPALPAPSQVTSAGESGEVAPKPSPDSPTVDPAIVERLEQRIDQLHDELRHACQDALKAATDDRYPHFLTPADIPELSALIGSFEEQQLSPQDRAMQKARQARKETAA